MDNALTNTISPMEALWALFQAQSKTVRREFTKRVLSLAKQEEEERLAKERNASLMRQLNSIRKEMKDGNCTTCNTKEELDAFFDSL